MTSGIRTLKARTKIVVTAGPSCNTRDKLLAVARAGTSVFRLNFSHGDHASHQAMIGLIRSLPEELGRPVAIMADLCGPKLRVRDVPGEPLELKKDDFIWLTSGEPDHANRRIQVNFANLHLVVHRGGFILIDDGLVRLRIEDVAGEAVKCRVMYDCVLRSRKGVNLPGAHLPIPALTEKDHADLAFALKAGVDLVALSFVRTASDVQVAKHAMEDLARVVPIIAKIEKGEAIDNLDDILRIADGAMVARGDLGVEIPLENVPGAQARIIRSCNRLSKPVITATQMLTSMVSNPTPTRAEVSDIYNAIMQGTDAVMLSNETASGAFPVESVEVMTRVAMQAEKNLEWHQERVWETLSDGTGAVSWAICSAAVGIAESLQLDAIVCPTQSGTTAMRVARLRPGCRILACTTNTDVINRLCLVWGVQPRLMRELWASEEEVGESDAIINGALKAAREHQLVRPGERVVVLAGLPLRTAGHTNLMRVVTIA